MTIEGAIELLVNATYSDEFQGNENLTTAHNMAICALEMQKELAEYSGMDICQFFEDYDYEENNISEYEMEASVDDFLIDEVKEEVEKKRRINNAYSNY